MFGLTSFDTKHCFAAGFLRGGCLQCARGLIVKIWLVVSHAHSMHAKPHDVGMYANKHTHTPQRQSVLIRQPVPIRGTDWDLVAL